MDVIKFKNIPPTLIGGSKSSVQIKLAQAKFPFSIAMEDGKKINYPRDVRILLNIQDGIVIGTRLDNSRFGKW